MEQEIINSIYTQWRAAKAEAQRQCEQRSLPNVAEAYRACRMFKGNETTEQIVALYKSTQGVEFCARYHFPSVNTVRLFKGENVERFGIYIDAGSLTLTEPKDKVLLIGRTTATVECAQLRRYEVVCLHGARAVINASRWAVVKVTAEQGCSVIKNIRDNAIIL